MNKIQLSVGQIAISCNKSYPDKPTIIFLHDSLGCIKLWRNFPQKLSEMTGCNSLVYDRLGYGQSENMQTHKRPINYLELEADILNELITRLELENVILFGHSDGGSIALIMASKYPTKIKAIISEAAHIFVDNLTLSGIYNAIEAFNTTNLRERLIKYHGSEKVDNVFKAWTETWTSEEYKNWNIESFLPNINCPILVIQGEKDEYGTEKQVDGIVNKVSGKTTKLYLTGLSHTPHKDDPEQILKHTTKYILNTIDE